MKTLLLTQDIWDVCLDANGNWAVASDPYSEAQDVASAIRTFLGEVWYDTTQGLPYFSEILGQLPSLQFIRSQVEAAALTVPGIQKAQCTILTFVGRVMTGSVEVIDSTGVANNVSF